MTPDGLGLGGDWVDSLSAPTLVTPLPGAATAPGTTVPGTTVPGPAVPGADGVAADEDEERCFPGLEEWVVDWLAPTVRRQHNENAFRWCPQWWAHAEAISRLNGLWEAWENARTDGAVAMLGWWQVLDHHLTILTSTGGPFAQCTHTRHGSDGTPLTTAPAPRGTWAEE